MISWAADLKGGLKRGSMGAMFRRLVRNWVYGGALAGVLLFALTPLIASGWPPSVLAAWIQLPLYMVHQYEEHDADRFRRFVNLHLTGGRKVLSRFAIFIINVPGVWGVIAVSFWLASMLRPGLALIAIYLTLVNALAHVGALLALRCYNPGLITAMFGFLPIGAWSWYVVTIAGARVADHVIGLAIAAGIHGVIAIHIRRASLGSRLAA